MVIYRSVTGESWVYGRSKCENCAKTIAWYDNIPLLSYFLLGRKCRNCKTPIGISHPVIEFLTGSMVVWWYWGGSLFFRLTLEPFHYIQPLFWLIVGLLLLIIFFADLFYMIIPDEAVLVLTALTFFYRVTLTAFGVMQPIDFVRTLLVALGAATFFFSLWYFTKGKGMGFGDVKFSIPFALLLGWPNTIVGIMVAFIMGSVVAIGLLATRRKKLKQVIPFGPFLVASTIVTLVWGNALLNWYLSFL